MTSKVEKRTLCGSNQVCGSRQGEGVQVFSVESGDRNLAGRVSLAFSSWLRVKLAVVRVNTDVLILRWRRGASCCEVFEGPLISWGLE